MVMLGGRGLCKDNSILKMSNFAKSVAFLSVGDVHIVRLVVSDVNL